MSEYGAETKVGDFEVTVSCEKEVFGFKVTVGDTFGVDEFLTAHSLLWWLMLGHCLEEKLTTPATIWAK